MEKKLYRSRTNKMLFGICGGLGDYLNVDPTVVRLIAVILGIVSIGVIAYIIAALIIPEQPQN